MPSILLFAGTKNFCPGTRMARSYKNNIQMCQSRTVFSDSVDNRTSVLYHAVIVLHVDFHDLGRE